MSGIAPRPVRWALYVCLVWTFAYAVQGWMPGPHPLNPTLLSKYASDAVQLTAGLLCLWRCVGLSGRERRAWALIGTGIVVWTLGDLYWAFELADLASIPVPSPADVGYLLFVPLTFAGLVALARARLASVPRTLAVDGLSAALAVGAVSSATILEVALGTGGNTAQVATNLAYPLTDMVLLGMIVAAIALRGWRLDGMWALLAAGTVAYWITDSLYLVTVANDTYNYPSPFDFGWTLAAVLYAVAAWRPVAKPAAEVRRGGMREMVLPLGFATLGLAVLVYATTTRINVLAVVLAASSLVAVMVRLGMTFAENLEVLQSSRREALTDALTGLGNRRALGIALRRRIAEADDGRPLVLALFDLDGFKYYNDSFGHPAGDELLVLLGTRLARSLEGRGEAFRMGGDEFCVLIEPGSEVAQPIVDAARAALSERGEGFEVGCSHGSVVLPREASDSASALRVADQRMYASKQSSSRTSASSQSKDVLLQALTERDPSLRAHVGGVAGLAEAIAVRLGLDREEVEQVRLAAELHDIGKVAIPDGILAKPGPLDEAEWAFIRRHPLVGERIINAAPALGRVAALVRSSHERFDGAGYPDGLAGTGIPLGSRIVAICDAFDAMTSDRPYRAAMTKAAAFAELRACAGTQFDPVVVEAFGAALAESASVTVTA